MRQPLRGDAEVDAVAGVVLDDVQHAFGACHGAGGLEDLPVVRGCEDLARTGRVEHPGADEAQVHRLVPRAAAGHEPDPAGRRTVQRADETVVGVMGHQVGVHPGEARQRVGNQRLLGVLEVPGHLRLPCRAGSRRVRADSRLSRPSWATPVWAATRPPPLAACPPRSSAGRTVGRTAGHVPGALGPSDAPGARRDRRARVRAVTAGPASVPPCSPVSGLRAWPAVVEPRPAGRGDCPSLHPADSSRVTARAVGMRGRPGDVRDGRLGGGASARWPDRGRRVCRIRRSCRIRRRSTGGRRLPPTGRSRMVDTFTPGCPWNCAQKRSALLGEFRTD